MKKFYVAYSIPGTNCFITANIETDQSVLLNDGTIIIGNQKFTSANSRRPDYKPEDGQKLHSKMLTTSKGLPVRSYISVVKFFNTLEKEGWTIDRQNFINKYWRNK